MINIFKKAFWFQFASPKTFYPLAGQLAPWFGGIALILGVIGLYLALFLTPADFKQGEVYRIIYIHVPLCWMSMFIYILMAFYSVLSLSLNTRLSDMMARALAPTGALFTFLALWTGALWGKPTWGAYWVWGDARLMSYLFLLFLYIGYLSLNAAIEDNKRAARATAILAIVGAVNIPIIYFSVEWWSTLHQGPSIGKKTTMAPIMLWSMLIMLFSFWSYTIMAAFYRVRAIILEDEKRSAWTEELIEEGGR